MNITEADQSRDPSQTEEMWQDGGTEVPVVRHEQKNKPAEETAPETPEV